MNRTLLAMTLLLSAAGAFAAEPAASGNDAPGCPKAEPVQEKSPDETTKTSTRPGTPAPVRSRTTTSSRGTPRWHSMLPGMFR